MRPLPYQCHIPQHAASQHRRSLLPTIALLIRHFRFGGGPVQRHNIHGIVLTLLLVGGCIVVGQEAPPAPIPLKGPTMGTVMFPHSAHTRVAGKCEVCHHASKPEKPLKAPQEDCTDCHTKPPTPPVTIGLEAVFHDPTATNGLCITCHKTENSHGKAAPVLCAD